MRQIVDAVAIEIEFEAVAPEIADTVYAPACARNIRAAGFDRMQIAHENIFRELVVIRVRADAQTDVILRHPIGDDFVGVALIEGETDRILGDLVLFELCCDRTIEK